MTSGRATKTKISSLRKFTIIKNRTKVVKRPYPVSFRRYLAFTLTKDTSKNVCNYGNAFANKNY